MTLEERDLVKGIAATCHAKIEEAQHEKMLISVKPEDLLMIVKILDDQCNRLWIAENK